MKKERDLLSFFTKLSKKDRIKFIIASVLTLSLFIVIPVFAWFSSQRKMATMAKIDSPAKLSLKSGAREEIVQFKMSGIDVTQTSPKSFVFCVEGEDISRYNIQLAHTTNINFNYTIYKAKQAPVGDTTGAEYVKADNSKVYYNKASTALPGAFINNITDSVDLNRTIGNRDYEASSYNNGMDADERQKFAEPLYWQTTTPIAAEESEYDEIEAENSFRNYYVLEVSWDSNVLNDKETDIVYITVQVA